MEERGGEVEEKRRRGGAEVEERSHPPVLCPCLASASSLESLDRQGVSLGAALS